MAIARDNHGYLSSGTRSSSSDAYTCSGANLILFVAVTGELNSDNITGATYNGVSMTLIAKQGNGADRWTYLFYLVGPATGSHNIVVSASSSSFIEVMAASYTGVSQTGQPDAHNNTTNTSTAFISTSVATVADNCWIFGFSHTNLVETYTGSGSATKLDDDSNNSTMSTFDTNGLIHPAGATSVGFSFSGTPSFAEIIAASFSPALASATGGSFMLNFI